MRSLPPRAVDTSIAAILLVLAILVRLPHYDNIPAYTDEVSEVAMSIDMAEGGPLPLVHTEGYRGPVWPYLLAGWLKVYGLRPGAARMYALLIGALTVAATFGLARVLSGRTAATIAGAFMATAFSHVALNSHVAWSNNSTPLWTTVALTATVLGAGSGYAVERKASSTAWLAAAGLMWGFALHTHPSALAPLVGAAVWFAADRRRRALFRSRAPWLGAALTAIVLSPMVVHNALDDWSGIREATAPRQTVATDRSPRAFADRAVSLAGQVGRMAGAGPLDYYPSASTRPEAEPQEADEPSLAMTVSLLRPWTSALYALLLIGSFAIVAVKGPRVLAAVALVSAALLLAANDSYENFYDTRYVALLLPLAYAALGSVTAPYLKAGQRHRILLSAALAALTLYPLVATAAYYEREITAGRTNQAMTAVAERLAARAHEGEHAFVDKQMRPLKLGGGGDPTRAFAHLLRLRGVRYDLSDTDEIRWFLLNDASTTFWIVAADQTSSQLCREFDLTQWESGQAWSVLERPGDRGG